MFVFANITQTIQVILCWGDLEILTTVLSVADLPIANATFMMIRFWSKKKGIRINLFYMNFKFRYLNNLLVIKYIYIMYLFSLDFVFFLIQ
jgi:hypothetical protein